MIKNKLNYINLLLIIGFAACNNPPKYNLKECKALNDSAVALINKFQLEKNNTQLLDSADALLDEAINCSSKKLVPYSNKLSIAFIKKDFNQALMILDSMNNLSKTNYNKYDNMKAIAYEQLRMTDSARKYYNSALGFYDELIQRFPDSAEFVFERCKIIWKLKGKEPAVNEMDEFINKHPTNYGAQIYKEGIVNLFEKPDTVPYDLFINIR